MNARRASLTDLSVLIDMMTAFNRGENISWSPREGEPALRRLILDDALGHVGVLHDAGAALGYFVLTWGYDLEWNGRDAFLTELYLVPEARGARHGTSALPLIESIAMDHGARALHLMVRPENAVARRLYDHAGFTAPARIFLTKELVKAS